MKFFSKTDGILTVDVCGGGVPVAEHAGKSADRLRVALGRRPAEADEQPDAVTGQQHLLLEVVLRQRRVNAQRAGRLAGVQVHQIALHVQHLQALLAGGGVLRRAAVAASLLQQTEK